MRNASSPALSAPSAGSAEVKELFGDIDDHTVAAILALKPTLAQLEEASLRALGAGDAFADVREEKGVVAKIAELVAANEFEDPRRS